jgi:PAS domain S-box-containing protein
MTATDASLLCATAKLLTSVLDGASERAVLVADDGTVLHMNGAAEHFLYCDDKTPHVTDFLVCEEDWRSVTHCHIVMKDGKTKTITRSERNIHMVKLDPCPCCSQQYYTGYICSKHERVREVVDHAFDPVLTVDEKGIICTVNEAATELFGYTESEMVGHNLRMICGGGHAENHDRYMKNYMETGVKKVIGRKREVLARKKNGSEFPCELGIQEISDVSSGKRYFCGFIKDLTLIKKHEAELQERQALNQAMINSSFDPMLEIDEAGIIKVVNDSACAMFGYTRDEFLGSNISMICGDGHAAKHEAYMRRYLEGGEKHIIGRKRQVKARRKDGSEFVVELGVQEVILSTTGKKAFCGFIRDLTAQNKDKRALRKQQQIIHGKFFGKDSSGGAEGDGCPAK